MKKFTIFGLILVLVAFTAIPVFAAGNGHGNNGNAGQGNGSTNRDQVRTQETVQAKSSHANKGLNRTMHTRTRTPFYIQGTIATSATGSLTINVVHGNAQVKQFVGSTVPLTVLLTGSTKVYEVMQGDETEGSTEKSALTVDTAKSKMESDLIKAALASSSDQDESGGRVLVTDLSKLKPGAIVAIHGNVVGGQFNATVITIYTHLANIQPEVNEP